MIHLLNRSATRTVLVAICALSAFSAGGAIAVAAATSSSPSTHRTANADTGAAIRAAGNVSVHDTQTAQVRRVVYVCPMHPKVRSQSRGNCPLCGMALVRRVEVVNASLPAAPAARIDTATAQISVDSPVQGNASGAAGRAPAASGGHSCCSAPRTETR